MLHRTLGLMSSPLQAHRNVTALPQPKGPPTVPLQTVRVHHGRTAHEVQLPVDATIASLRMHLPSALVDACLMAKGKKLRDDAPLAGIGKLMAILNPAAPGAAASSAFHVTLRCLASGLVVRNVEVTPSLRVAELAEIAKKAFCIQPESTASLFAAAGKQVLRPELSLADYAIAAGTELFVAPVYRHQTVEEGAGGVGWLPATAATSEPSAAAKKGASASASARVKRSAAEGGSRPAAASSVVPDRLMSGLTSFNPRSMASGPVASLGAMLQGGLPAEVRAQIERQIGGALQEALADGALGGGADGAALTLSVEEVKRAAGEAQQMLAHACRGSRTLDLVLPPHPAAVSGDGGVNPVGDEREIEQLEAACGRMVDAIEPDARAARGCDQESAAESAARRKQEAREFGKGLSKGFLNAKQPKRRKRKAPIDSEPARPPTTAAVLEPIDPNTCGAAYDERVARAGTASLGPKPPTRTAQRGGGRRCTACHVRLPLSAEVSASCKCKQLFCGAHMHSHACTYDFKSEARAHLRETNTPVRFAKL